MNMMKTLWSSIQGDPVFMRRVNGWLTILWLLAAVPICVFLSDSVPFLVFISVYAVVTGHWSSWQAARVEVRQEEDADVKEVLEKVEAIHDGQAQGAQAQEAEEVAVWASGLPQVPDARPQARYRGEGSGQAAAQERQAEPVQLQQDRGEGEPQAAEKEVT